MVSTIIGTTLLLLLGGFILRLGFTILRNLIHGRRFHQALADEFNQLRLSRMLTALGIDKARYIHRTPVLEIQRQMQHCRECHNTGECDIRLENDDIEPGQIDFCNNQTALQEHRQDQFQKNFSANERQKRE